MDILKKYFTLLISVFIVLVASTISTWWITKQVVAAKTNEIFLEQVITLESWITNRFDLYKTVSQGLQSFWAHADTVTIKEWDLYTKSLNIEENFPSITSLAYAKRINDDYIVDFVYPPERSAALGFNIASEERRLAAINKAIDEATVTVTDRVTLAADQSPGFLMFGSLYSEGKAPEGLTERRASVQGVSGIVFKSENVFKNIFEPIDPFPSLDFELYKGKVLEDDHVLYDHDASHYIQRNEGMHTLKTRKTIIIDNEIFTLLVVSKPSFGLSKAEKNLPNLVLVGGFVISTLIFALFYNKIKHQNLFN